MSVTISFYKFNKIVIRNSTIQNDISDFFINLDVLLKDDNNKKLIVEQNSITVYKDLNNLYINIQFNDGKVKAIYYDGSICLTSIVMIRNIKKFRIIKKGKLNYIVLEHNDGGEYIRCI